jgi:Spy/CpxP family protein refolding chaperone
MRNSHWKAVAIAAVLLMTVLAMTALAQEKKSKPAPAGKSAAQTMPGCTMKSGTSAEKPGCGTKGGTSAEKPGCSTKGGTSAEKPGCGMKGEMKCCSMKGGMGKDGGCKSGDMKCCGPKGDMGRACGMRGEMKSCGMKGGMGAGMPGCGMKGGVGEGAEGGPMRGPGMGARMGADPGAMLLHGLDLTPEQQKKVADVHEGLQRQMIQNQADLRIAAMDLEKLMHAETPDQARIDAQIDKIAGLRTAMAKARVASLLEVRAMLTPEQLKKWQAGPMMGEDEDD